MVKWQLTFIIEVMESLKEYIAKHNKKNIALAAGGIATGSALVAKSLKDNKKK